MTNETKEHRTLAAIMFSDMVGYSALSQKNEAIALELLQLQNELLLPIFPKYSGKVIKTIGDAFLVEFSSAVEAVNCAIEMQKKLHEYNATALAGRNVQIRIGIHVGDIVHRKDDVFGDGVNIAARVQPLAKPGGICITQDVFRQIQNKTEAEAIRLGKGSLKNIEVATAIYRVILPWEKKHVALMEQMIFSLKRRRTHSLAAVIVLVVMVAGLSWWLFRGTPERNFSEKEDYEELQKLQVATEQVMRNTYDYDVKIKSCDDMISFLQDFLKKHQAGEWSVIAKTTLKSWQSKKVTLEQEIRSLVDELYAQMKKRAIEEAGKAHWFSHVENINLEKRNKRKEGIYTVVNDIYSIKMRGGLFGANIFQLKVTVSGRVAMDTKKVSVDDQVSVKE